MLFASGSTSIPAGYAERLRECRLDPCALRHQNGQVHTIPFGQVPAVTNFSRDWSVIKFNLHLDPTVDIETVRKTVKRVGEELLDDPEIGADFIQPLKMQGVIDVLQTTMIV